MKISEVLLTEALDMIVKRNVILLIEYLEEWHNVWLMDLREDNEISIEPVTGYTHSDRAYMHFAKIDYKNDPHGNRPLNNPNMEAMKHGWVRLVYTRQNELNLEFMPSACSPVIKQILMFTIIRLGQKITGVVMDLHDGTGKTRSMSVNYQQAVQTIRSM